MNLELQGIPLDGYSVVFSLTALDEEHPQDMRAVLPPEEEMAFLGLKTLDQRRILMLLMKQPEDEISEVEVGVPHEVSWKPWV